MKEISNPENVLLEIPKHMLLETIMKYKKMNYRLSQICAAYIADKFELSYSFVDDDTNLMTNIRVVVGIDEEVPSVTEIEPCALFYENEMKELFGVKIQMISKDYNDKLYRIRQSHPMGPQDKTAADESPAANEDKPAANAAGAKTMSAVNEPSASGNKEVK